MSKRDTTANHDIAGSGHATAPASIVAYRTIPDAARAGVDAGIDSIFFDASSVKQFANAKERRAFHWLWLGRYLAEEPEHGFVALRPNGTVAGYLVASLRDPANREEFAQLTYFRDFAHLTAAYPAHLHVNVATGERGGGIGARLVGALCDHCRAHGVAGVHVVTGAGMRNVGFYERLGFSEIGRVRRHGGEVVMLAMRLT